VVQLSNSGVKYWRITVDHPIQTDDTFEYKSLILGDWLRHDCISIGDENPEQASRKKFNEMQNGDKIAVVVDGCLWAVGEIKGFVHRIERKPLHSVRRNVIWYKIARAKLDCFDVPLKTKLANPNTVMSINEKDWNKIVEQLYTKCPEI